MSFDKSRLELSGERRRMAEDELSGRGARAPGEMGAEDVLALVHELQVHQVELEMQNEELRWAQREICSLHREYEELYEFAPCGYVTLDAGGAVTRCNLTGVRLLGVERARLIGASFGGLVARESRNEYRAALDLAGESEEKQSAKLMVIHADNETRWVLADIQAKKSPSGEVLQWRLALMDGAKGKRAEEALEKSLVEKDLLLKEIHHRVKNNFQVIIGLVQMQARSIPDAPMVQTLKELQERVRVMALVHERLYMSSSFSEINFGHYLKELTNNLAEVFGTSEIVLEVRVGDVFLEIETVITCGLITTEIVTNALKYAFSGSKAGAPPPVICVEFNGNESGYTLTVSDNGIGLPRGLDVSAATSMGLRLIHLWSTYQLNGSIETRIGPGTTYIICFPRRGRRRKQLKP